MQCFHYFSTIFPPVMSPGDEALWPAGERPHHHGVGRARRRGTGPWFCCHMLLALSRVLCVLRVLCVHGTDARAAHKHMHVCVRTHATHGPGPQDWAELEGMVSRAVLDDMKAAHQQLLERRRLRVRGAARAGGRAPPGSPSHTAAGAAGTPVWQQHGVPSTGPPPAALAARPCGLLPRPQRGPVCPPSLRLASQRDPPPQVLNVACDVREASLQMACLWGSKSVALFDEARAAEHPPPGCAPYWNLAFVDVISVVSVRLADDATGRQGTNRTARQGVFVLARGPVPRRVVPEVHAPWWLIGWL
jgi:hypothetical protein